MEYKALAVGLTDDFLIDLRMRLIQYDLRFTTSATVKGANRLLINQIFHLLIVDLEYLRSVRQTRWLSEIRHISFVPVIVLSDTPDENIKDVVYLGADICVSRKRPYATIADLAFAQLRRYTEYNHYNNPAHAETAPFQVGDIFIDPARRIVKVRSQPVNLRPREFSLLLYFMRNPHIVLSSEQICVRAWDMADYINGATNSVSVLRQAIEPDPKAPIYIKTVHRIGYCFTAHRSPDCNDRTRSKSVSN